jgi:hypothetical protein
MSEWIATADKEPPKDGTRFLGYDPVLLGAVICEWRHGAWWADADSQGGGGYGNTELTHWMPLPEPPNSNNKTSGTEK